MHTEKYQLSKVGHVLMEANRTMYGRKDCVSKSLIDPDRTHLNYNLIDHDYMYQRVKDLNRFWRGLKATDKMKANSNLMFGTVVTLPKDFFPGMEDLTGAELIAFIQEDPERERQVREFFQITYYTLKKIYGLHDEDVCSAYVHMDESTPHLHFYAIPHYHPELHVDAQTERYMKLVTQAKEDPEGFVADQIEETTKKRDRVKDDAQKKKYQKQLDTIAADPEAYIAKKIKGYEGKLKGLGKETVSYEHTVPRSTYNRQHKDLAKALKEHFGRDISIENGKTIGIDVTKLSAEERKRGKAAFDKGFKDQKEAELASLSAEADVVLERAKADAKRDADIIIDAASEKAEEIIDKAYMELEKFEVHEVDFKSKVKKRLGKDDEVIYEVPEDKMKNLLKTGKMAQSLYTEKQNLKVQQINQERKENEWNRYEYKTREAAAKGEKLQHVQDSMVKQLKPDENLMLSRLIRTQMLFDTDKDKKGNPVYSENTELQFRVLDALDVCDTFTRLGCAKYKPLSPTEYHDDGMLAELRRNYILAQTPEGCQEVYKRLPDLWQKSEDIVKAYQATLPKSYAEKLIEKFKTAFKAALEKVEEVVNKIADKFKRPEMQMEDIYEKD